MCHDIGHPDGDTLQSALDGLLDPAGERDVRRHLEACPACRAEAEAFEGLFRELSSLDLPFEPAPGFTARVMGRVAAVDAARRVRRPRVAVPAAVAAVVALLLAAWALLGTGAAGPGPGAGDGFAGAAALAGALVKVADLVARLTAGSAEALVKIGGLGALIAAGLPASFWSAVIGFTVALHGLLYLTIRAAGRGAAARVPASRAGSR